MDVSVADSSLYIFNQNLPRYRIFFLKSTKKRLKCVKKKKMNYKDNCSWSGWVPVTLMDTEALLEMSIQR